MILGGNLIDEHGTQLSIVYTDSGSVGVNLNVLESSAHLKTFRISDPIDLLYLMALLVGAGSDIGWLRGKGEAVLGKVLVAEARRINREARRRAPSNVNR